MSRKRRTPEGRHKMRKGPTAIQGGTISRPMNFLGHVPNAPRPKIKREPFSEPRSIAELWGTDAPGGDMAAMRAIRKAKIAARAVQSMNDQRNYLQSRVRAAVA